MSSSNAGSSGGNSKNMADQARHEAEDQKVLQSRMSRIGHKIFVLSGKGGVGKSTVAVNLAASLALAGKRVGLLDIDIHGPSVPKLLHLEDETISGDETGLIPVNIEYGAGSISVMSIGFLLRGSDDAVIWRGPRKFGVIRQFLKDVEWGDLDYLIVDSPPGTGDEPLAVAQLIPDSDGAVVVTTPQQVAVQDVRRCVMFCRQLNLPVVGVVENMSGFTCPTCGDTTRIFGGDGGKDMAANMGVPFLGAIPIEPAVVMFGDSGVPMVKAMPHSETAKAFGRIVKILLEKENSGSDEINEEVRPVPGQAVRIAVPVTSGVLSSHFGHCEHFAMFDVAADGRTVEGRKDQPPPPHEPGTFPKWLHEQGASIIIAGGIGSRAVNLFSQNEIRVVTGAVGGDPDSIVKSFLEGSLETGSNTCDH